VNGFLSFKGSTAHQVNHASVLEGRVEVDVDRAVEGFAARRAADGGKDRDGLLVLFNLDVTHSFVHRECDSQLQTAGLALAVAEAGARK
jgi:hypothetical protein